MVKYQRSVTIALVGSFWLSCLCCWFIIVEVSQASWYFFMKNKLQTGFRFFNTLQNLNTFCCSCCNNTVVKKNTYLCWTEPRWESEKEVASSWSNTTADLLLNLTAQRHSLYCEGDEYSYDWCTSKYINDWVCHFF